MGSLFLLRSFCEQAAAGLVRAFPVHFVPLQSNSTQFNVHNSRAATENCMKCDISPQTSHQSEILHSLIFICIHMSKLLYEYKSCVLAIDNHCCWESPITCQDIYIYWKDFQSITPRSRVRWVCLSPLQHSHIRLSLVCLCFNICKRYQTWTHFVTKNFFFNSCCLIRKFEKLNYHMHHLLLDWTFVFFLFWFRSLLT